MEGVRPGQERGRPGKVDSASWPPDPVGEPAACLWRWQETLCRDSGLPQGQGRRAVTPYHHCTSWIAKFPRTTVTNDCKPGVFETRQFIFPEVRILNLKCQQGCMSESSQASVPCISWVLAPGVPWLEAPLPLLSRVFCAVSPLGGTSF